MTAFLLKSRRAPEEFLARNGMHKDYNILGEFYEENSNANGGKDYLVKDLEKHLKDFPPETEYEHLTDYSDDLKHMEIFSILLPLSKDPYISSKYWRYRVYVKK
ncbi:hypothetical protein EXS74_03410 [Candidatus Woesearchaeota archaeon]|nr:hypothetical protein [Candidatus Woesearchaeota archaeon]